MRGRTSPDNRFYKSNNDQPNFSYVFSAKNCVAICSMKKYEIASFGNGDELEQLFATHIDRKQNLKNQIVFRKCRFVCAIMRLFFDRL